ncbi:hypothetical protein H257_18388 [Aphanomyces astaci]|uniref:Uncharacterized protein n=1 Tax=Aphanomyces astaci TaxID=112090 RepID=W4FD13_APHAT|nr:hypothetical protein H257_18388 [Aphanomyces astaci]ETV64789.1 hypothetical protein H257_18388 [Aphanomyces astaci]|eukprot:XP_009845732.1 hypothetical protein H257_18388 [Aphanomyces astaci]
MTNILAFLTVFATVASATANQNDNHELDAATEACLRARRSLDGEEPQLCDADQDYLGSSCYDKCPSGTTRVGYGCVSNCPPEFTDKGRTCLKKGEYSRGVGYPWKFGDTFFDSTGMFQRCENDYGEGNCEWYGAVVYPKCSPGFTAVECCDCHPPLPDCKSFGLLPVEGLLCRKKVIPLKSYSPKCRPYEDLVRGRCFPKCRPWYTPGLPV